MKQPLNIAMIGQGFMGRAHSNAWLMVEKFFNTPLKPVLKIAAGTRPTIKEFAEQWGYEESTTDWRSILSREDVDVIDVGSPTYLHKEMVLAAVNAGKHVVCEKPCALSAAEAREMAEAADKAGVVHYLNHNYRRVPAIAYARQLIENGRLGDLYHYRGSYFQDWILDPSFPLTWQLREETAGGGPLYDLGSHAVDLARFLIGEPVSVMAQAVTFVKERPLPGRDASAFAAGSAQPAGTGAVTVDDAASLLLTFENGAMGSIEVSRFCAGCKNKNVFEIYGSRGALKYDLEDFNTLWFLDREAPGAEEGFKRILVTEPEHPYAGAWWAPGHAIGYQNTFFHAFADFITAVADQSQIVPNLNDGAAIAKILEAARKSDQEGRRVMLADL